MKYKIIGIRPTHKEMKEMIGKSLLKITEDGWLEKVYITAIKINAEDKWEFEVIGENDFKENQPLFVNVKSAKRYAKQNNLPLKEFY